MTEEQIEAIKSNPELVVRYVASKRLMNYARYIHPELAITHFHKVYYEVLNKFAQGEIRKLIISVPPQHGKALRIDTPVLTTSGWKRHGDLRVGDYVFGDDGKPKKVLWNSGAYDWHTMNVDFADGFTMIAAHEHLWKVYRDKDDHKGRREFINETQEIFSGRNRRNPFIKADCVLQMPERDLPVDPYLLGYWLGDGYSASGHICSGSEDAWNLAQFGEVKKAKNGHNTVYYRVNVVGLAKTLRKIGLRNNKHIPIEYILASREQRVALLQGLMDSDGCVNKDRGMCEFTQKSGRLVDDVYVLLRTLGYKPTRHEYTAILKGSDCGKKVRLCFVPNKGEKIFRLPRKQERLDNKTTADRIDKTRFFINRISEGRDEIVNCIQVEGGMYLAGRELVPTHNSLGSSIILPSFLLGQNPDYKIVIGSYNADNARNFNTEVQKIINTEQYKAIFPDSYLNTERVRMNNVYKCNSEISEMVGHKGFLRAVGRSGSLTGKSVDISILDDVYKDFSEANSPLIREQAWKWYTTVVRTRLHNNSQEIIVFTRWHEDDLIGRLEKSGERIRVAKTWEDLENVPRDMWVMINFPALKVGKPTELDPRKEGEALWEAKHSRASLLAQRALDPVQFECLYQGDPCSSESLLYGTFKTYGEKSEYGTFIRRGCYIDTADKGTDNLCSITYDVYRSPNMIFNESKRRFEPIIFILVTDIIYTPEGTEITTISVPQQISTQGSQRVWVESNNGGEQFGVAVSRKVRAEVKTFHNSVSKETRIISNSSVVMQSVVFPVGWETRWESVYRHLSNFMRNFSANLHDDCEDALTGIVEKEVINGDIRPYSARRRGVSRRN